VWRGRHWQVGDTISTPGADRTEAVWVAVEVSGTRVTFAPAREEAQPNVG